MPRIAVIENEFGEVGVDQDLVINAEEEIFEMNNGCICCTVRGDLIRILGNLMKRRDKFDYILVETTGMADPGPVAVEFFVEAGEKQAATNKFVERDFVHLPTFASEDGRFVYAVPKGHPERTEDRDLKWSTHEIFSRYQAWRKVYIGDGKLGAVELLKNWIAVPKSVGYFPQASPCQNRLAPILRYRRLRCR